MLCNGCTATSEFGWRGIECSMIIRPFIQKYIGAYTVLYINHNDEQCGPTLSADIDFVGLTLVQCRR